MVKTNMFGFVARVTFVFVPSKIRFLAAKKGGLAPWDPFMACLDECNKVFEGSIWCHFNNPGISNKMINKPWPGVTECKYLLEYIHFLRAHNYRISLIGFSIGAMRAFTCAAECEKLSIPPQNSDNNSPEKSQNEKNQSETNPWYSAWRSSPLYDYEKAAKRKNNENLIESLVAVHGTDSLTGFCFSSRWQKKAGG